ncbi:MAG TPA: paraquat-inducible protein A [Usitatibacter sp.]|nr:paraquat-inducible protein A [Usitatibacter sp.]
MTATAAKRGLLTCGTCGLLNQPCDPVEEAHCARCESPLHWRKPASIARTWAFLAAAAILYVPANLLPVIHSGSLFGSNSNTILGGVLYFWRTGSWALAIIVFAASIVVPATKIAALAMLLVTSQRRSRWRPAERTRLYRLTTYVGRWSMVDIYIGAVSVALVQLQPFAAIEPGPGAIYFGAVVILTMLASESFDPRLIWDGVDDARIEARGDLSPREAGFQSP